MFTVAILKQNQNAQTAAKVRVEKWFYTSGIPSHIHSNESWSFKNDIIQHLCQKYGIQQMTITLYNPWGNLICERFNQVLHKLLKTLPKDQEVNWPAYLISDLDI